MRGGAVAERAYRRLWFGIFIQLGPIGDCVVPILWSVTS